MIAIRMSGLARATLVAVAVALAAACDEESPTRDPTGAPSVAATRTPTAVPPTPASPTETPPTATATPGGPCLHGLAAPDAADPSVTVREPVEDVETDSPLPFYGEVRAFEAVFNARLIDGAGVVLGELALMASEGAPARVTFEAAIGFDVALPTVGCLQVFTLSARDGSMQDVVQREVLLLPGAREAGGVCPLNGSPPDATDPDIELETPAAGDSPARVISVRGRARVFEAVVSARVLAPAGVEIATASLMAAAGAPEKAPFAGEVTFAVGRPTSACLQVYSVSPRDGSVENLVQREVVLRP